MAWNALLTALVGLMSDPVPGTEPGPDCRIERVEDLASRRERSARSYLEFLRVASMNAGLYELPAGAEDRQRPHDEDEVYVVLEGRARFRSAGETTDVGPGAVIYVRAGVEHRFEEISEDLRVIVVFASGGH